MTWLAIGAYVVYLLVAFVARTLIQVRRTGDTGFRGLSGNPGTPGWWAGVLFAVALAVGFTAPIAGPRTPDPGLDRSPGHQPHRTGTRCHAMALTGLGLTLMVPHVLAVTGFAALLVAVHLQVRVVEEPYLRVVPATPTPGTQPAPVGSCPAWAQ